MVRIRHHAQACSPHTPSLDPDVECTVVEPLGMLSTGLASCTWNLLRLRETDTIGPRNECRRRPFSHRTTATHMITLGIEPADWGRINERGRIAEPWKEFSGETVCTQWEQTIYSAVMVWEVICDQRRPCRLALLLQSLTVGAASRFWVT